MGCHTWIRTHLQEKAKEWSTDYLTRVKKYYKENINTWSKMDPDEFNDYLRRSSDCDNYYLNTGIRTLMNDGTNRDGNYNLKLNLYELELSYYSSTGQCELQKLTLINRARFIYDQVIGPATSLEDIAKIDSNLLYILNTPYCYINGKVYLRCEEPNDLINDRIYDIFRIPNHDQKPCKSFEDCLKVISEYNVDISNEKLQKLKDYYSKYPDTIIEFG